MDKNKFLKAIESYNEKDKIYISSEQDNYKNIAIKNIRTHLYKLINPAYMELFTKEFYQAYLGGSKNAGKSFTAIGALAIIELLRYSKYNVIIVRETIIQNKRSTYNQVIKAMREIWNKVVYPLPKYKSFDEEFNFIKSPQPEIVHKETKQKILFSGRDNPDNLQSITCEVGWVNLFINEEAIASDAIFQSLDINKARQDLEIILDSSMRGDKSDPYYKPRYLSLFNSFADTDINAQMLDKYTPYNKKWMEKHGKQIYYDPDHFNTIDPINNNIEHKRGLLVIRTNIKTNPFKSNETQLRAEKLKITDFDKWEIIYNGKTGKNTLSIYSNALATNSKILPYSNNKMIIWGIGVDTGRTHSATTFNAILTPFDKNKRKHMYWGFDSYYHSNNIANQNSEQTFTGMEYAYQFVNWLLSILGTYTIDMEKIRIAFDNESDMINYQKIVKETFIKKGYENIFDLFIFHTNENKNKGHKRKMERVKQELLLVDYNYLFFNPDPLCPLQQELPLIIVKQNPNKDSKDALERVDDNDHIIEGNENWFTDEVVSIITNLFYNKDISKSEYLRFNLPEEK